MQSWSSSRSSGSPSAIRRISAAPRRLSPRAFQKLHDLVELLVLDACQARLKLLDLLFGLHVRLVIGFSLCPIPIGLAIFAHHDERREEDGFERYRHRE